MAARAAAAALAANLNNQNSGGSGGEVPNFQDQLNKRRDESGELTGPILQTSKSQGLTIRKGSEWSLFKPLSISEERDQHNDNMEFTSGSGGYSRSKLEAGDKRSYSSSGDRGGRDEMEMDEDSSDDDTKDSPPQVEKKKDEEEKRPEDANKPVAINSVIGTPWCVVWTGDSRSFFYNAVSKESHWVMPEELKDNEQVEKLLSQPPKPKGRKTERSRDSQTRDFN